MKIIILHGDDTAKSYGRLMKFVEAAKKRGWEILYDEFPNTPSLFGIDRLIIYRDFSRLTKQDIKNFDRFDGTLVVYNEGLLPATFLKLMPQDFKMEKYELPKILFTFLESFYPGNSERSLKLLHDLIKTEAVEMIFFMLSRHLRDLYWISIDATNPQFPSWRASKLKSQAGKFGQEKLKQIISDLADIDIKVKTSKADLLTELDLLIVKQLE
jgi:hypothetical protein